MVFDPLLSLCLATRPPVTPSTLWGSWSFAPEIVIPLLAMLGIYGHSSLRAPAPLSKIGSAAFLAGWLLLVVALVSPLCRLAATLAWAHMVQHTILVALAPLLLVLGMRPESARRLNRQVPSYGHVAALIASAYAAVIWLAHAPGVYEAALRGPVTHLALVALLLGASVAFWDMVLRAPPNVSAATADLGGVLLCFTAMVQTGLLGALITFAQEPWYAILVSRAAAWGLNPLTDQRLAGLIMWVPMSVIYLGVCLALMWRCLERATPQAAGQ